MDEQLSSVNTIYNMIIFNMPQISHFFFRKRLNNAIIEIILNFFCNKCIIRSVFFDFIANTAKIIIKSLFLKNALNKGIRLHLMRFLRKRK